MLDLPSLTRIEVAIDEAGRGPLAFDVCAAAVIMPSVYDEDDKFVKMIKDSKKVTEKNRRVLAEYIKSKAIAYGIGTASVEEIDQINILNATYLAMHRALETIEKNGSAFDHILVDGDKFKPYISKAKGTWVPYTCEVDGDARLLNIAAASILAKDHRDTQIINLMKQNPDIDEKYGFTKNKGYGTAVHMIGLDTYGVSNFHRKSFAPVKKCLSRVN